MLFRSVVVGLALSILGIVVLAMVIHGDCELSSGCPEDDSFIDRLIATIESVTGDDDTLKQAKSIQVPDVPKVANKRPSSPTQQPTLRADEPKIAVNSLSQDHQYNLLNWNLVAYTSGSVDTVRLAGRAISAEGQLAVPSGDYVILSGWAGHPAYGMRFRDVLFSLCGKVIGQTSVNGKRSDVADAVHRNLATSGWSAKLAADHMPRCEVQELQAWGVAPIGINVFPLAGKTTFTFADQASASRRRYQTPTPSLMPARNGKAEIKKVKIGASVLRLRKCGDPSCNVVGRITAGLYDGYVLETAGGWTLLQIGESAGWVSNRYIAIQ